MHARHFVYDAERAVRRLAVRNIGEYAVDIDAAVDDVAFLPRDAYITFCGFGGQPLAGNRAAVFVGRIEEFVIFGFEETDRYVAARPHKCAPRLDEPRGHYADGRILHENHCCGHAAHRVAGDAYSVFIDVIEVVEILCAVIKSVCGHHRARIAGIFVIAVTFAVDYEHHETAAGKLDGVLKLHLTVVEIAVREYDAGRGVVGGCAVGLEQNAAHDFAVHILFLRHGFARFFVC